MFARDNALHRVGQDGPKYKVVSVDDNYSTFVFRYVFNKVWCFSTHSYLCLTVFSEEFVSVNTSEVSKCLNLLSSTKREQPIHSNTL